MKIHLKRIEEPFVLLAQNESGNTVNLDASPDIGGKGKGVRPMEILLISLAGCSGIDVLSILQKQKQNVVEFEVEVDGERETGKPANLFVNIHIHYKCKGDILEHKLKQAIELSLDKYCSVAKTLEKTAKITYSYKIET